MRGKEAFWQRMPSKSRITPAYAGKSELASAHVHFRKDHPRVCGEKDNGKRVSIPRYWITPAYAGKSHIIDSFMQLVKDHPRVCGEKLFLNPS